MVLPKEESDEVESDRLDPRREMLPLPIGSAPSDAMAQAAYKEMSNKTIKENVFQVCETELALYV